MADPTGRRRPVLGAAALLLAAAVLAACGGDDDSADSTPTPSATPVPYEGPAPGPEDHWHAPYLIEICGQQFEPLATVDNEGGLTSPGDGIIHIQPSTAVTAGPNATLGAFFGALRLELDDATLANPARGFSQSEGDACPDGSTGGVWRVGRWTIGAVDGEPEISTEGLADLAFTEDLLSFTIVFGPPDAEITRPPSLAQLRALSDVAVQPELPEAFDNLFGGVLSTETTCPEADGSSPRITSFIGPPPDCLEDGVTYTAVFDTSEGEVRVELDTETTPQTANNFVVLARYHYYDGTELFRTDVSIDIIQGGSPLTNGPNDPGPGYTIPDEGAAFTYTPGDLVMARTSEPDSAGAQFFFSAGPNTSNLDFSVDAEAATGGGTYVVFGTTVEGLDVLEAILALNVVDPTSALGSGPSRPVIVNEVTIEES